MNLIMLVLGDTDDTSIYRDTFRYFLSSGKAMWGLARSEAPKAEHMPITIAMMR